MLTILIQRVLELIRKYQDNSCLNAVNNVMGGNEKFKKCDKMLRLQKYTLPPRGEYQFMTSELSLQGTLKR